MGSFNGTSFWRGILLNAKLYGNLMDFPENHSVWVVDVMTVYSLGMLDASLSGGVRPGNLTNSILIFRGLSCGAVFLLADSVRSLNFR